MGGGAGVWSSAGMKIVSRTGGPPIDGGHRRKIEVGWRLLAVPAGLFLGRVVAQFIQWVSSVELLPEFDAWQSGTLPYPALLVSQLVILAVQVVVILRVRAGRFEPGQRIRRSLLAAGAIYFVAMVARLLSGQTWADGHSFLDATLPSIFHLVLAGFVVLLAFAAPEDADGDI